MTYMYNVHINMQKKKKIEKKKIRHTHSYKYFYHSMQAIVNQNFIPIRYVCIRTYFPMMNK